MSQNTALKRPDLATLRQMIGANEGSIGKEYFPFSYIEGGIPRGAITELSGALGSGKTELAIRFIQEQFHPPQGSESLNRRNSSVRIAWVEEEFQFYPPSLHSPTHPIPTENILYMEAGENVVWTALQTLRSQLFDILVLSVPPALIQERELRRIQLAAESHDVAVILLSEAPLQKGNWPIFLQASVERSITTRKPLFVISNEEKAKQSKDGNMKPAIQVEEEKKGQLSFAFADTVLQIKVLRSRSRRAFTSPPATPSVSELKEGSLILVK